MFGISTLILPQGKTAFTISLLKVLWLTSSKLKIQPSYDRSTLASTVPTIRIPNLKNKLNKGIGDWRLAIRN
ncbi:hypothetical protein [Scytonema sp. NUACC26]|uniref:hypothetical protein n=1 Tax=Scytonema sp. NUACC26 TaxID=3140176 RepID=UPI0034DC7BDA